MMASKYPYQALVLTHQLEYILVQQKTSVLTYTVVNTIDLTVYKSQVQKNTPLFRWKTLIVYM